MNKQVGKQLKKVWAFLRPHFFYWCLGLLLIGAGIYELQCDLHCHYPNTEGDLENYPRFARDFLTGRIRPSDIGWDKWKDDMLLLVCPYLYLVLGGLILRMWFRRQRALRRNRNPDGAQAGQARPIIVADEAAWPPPPQAL